MSTPFKRTVEAGYDRIANQYLASKDPEDPATLAALEELTGELAPGAPMRWRHYDGETSLALLSGSGLEIERAETRTTSGNESWLWVLSRKGG
ncbi:MAG: hypothetical protein ACJ732_02405 [Rubrobacteraceae bacterium]